MTTQPRPTYFWVDDDTEESLVGADWHQDAITSLCNGLRQVAEATSQPWHVGNQLSLIAWHPDGSPWRPTPDIMVHPWAGPERWTEIDAHVNGVPALVIEVASPSTWKKDVGLNPLVPGGAKAYEYPALGVADYLVFDPSADYLPQHCRGWRTVDGRPREWRPGALGRYHSPGLGISFQPEGLFLRIFGPDGAPIPFDHERTHRLVALDQRVVALDQRVVALDQRVVALNKQVTETHQENEELRRQLAAMAEAMARLHLPDTSPDLPRSDG